MDPSRLVRVRYQLRGWNAANRSNRRRGSNIQAMSTRWFFTQSRMKLLWPQVQIYGDNDRQISWRALWHSCLVSFLGEANLLLSCHESVLHYFLIYWTCNLLVSCENLSRWYGIQKGILESSLRIVHSMHKSFAILTVSPRSITSKVPIIVRSHMIPIAFLTCIYGIRLTSLEFHSVISHGA